MVTRQSGRHAVRRWPTARRRLPLLVLWAEAATLACETGGSYGLTLTTALFGAPTVAACWGALGTASAAATALLLVYITGSQVRQRW